MAEALFQAQHQGPGPVQAVLATGPMTQELRWRCQVCGQEMGHSQPLGLGLAALLLGTFLEWHGRKCGAGKEAPG